MDGCRYLESSISMLISDITITSLSTTLLNMPFLCRFTYVLYVGISLCPRQVEDDDSDDNDGDGDNDGDNVSDDDDDDSDDNDSDDDSDDDDGDNVSDDNNVDDDSSTYGCHYMDAYICSLKSFIHRN